MLCMHKNIQEFWKDVVEEIRGATSYLLSKDETSRNSVINLCIMVKKSVWGGVATMWERAERSL